MLKEILTYPMRLEYSESPKLVFLRPLTISSSNTPKLYTSDLTENKPCIAYS